MIVWLASYPKSGNTYLRSFLSTYFFSKDDSYSLLNLTGDNCIFNDIKENTNSKSKCNLNMEKALIHSAL